MVLIKHYFDYGSIGSTGKDGKDSGGKTLTIAKGANITIDSINPLDADHKNKEKDGVVGNHPINKQAFLVGSSRVGTLHNTTKATIEN